MAAARHRAATALPQPLRDVRPRQQPRPRRVVAADAPAIVVAAALLLAVAAVPAPSSAKGVPNVDGVWKGPAVIGLGLGSTFSLAQEVGDKGVVGVVGGFFAAEGACEDTPGDDGAEYKSTWRAIRLATNGTAKPDTLQTVTRLTAFERDAGAVTATEWCVCVFWRASRSGAVRSSALWCGAVRCITRHSPPPPPPTTTSITTHHSPTPTD